MQYIVLFFNYITIFFSIKYGLGCDNTNIIESNGTSNNSDNCISKCAYDRQFELIFAVYQAYFSCGCRFVEIAQLFFLIITEFLCMEIRQ